MLRICKGEELPKHRRRSPLGGDDLAVDRQFSPAVQIIKVRRVLQGIAVQVQAAAIGGLPQDKDHIGNIAVIAGKLGIHCRLSDDFLIGTHILSRRVQRQPHSHGRNVQIVVDDE